ncbi:hypothetical protein [Bacillus pakistanensis]|nr:hypothetical protein [Bacillus pakistanensis]
MNLLVEGYLSLIDTTEPDFIERLKQAARVKMDYYHKNPDVMQFLATVVLTDNVKLPEELEQRLSALQQKGQSILYDNIDPTLFRDDIDVDKAFKLIRWSIEGYQNELINHFKGQKIASVDFDPYWKEFYEYLDILKISFYKK